MIKLIMAHVLTALGITKFESNEAGAQILTAEQRTKLIGDYGEAFAAKFEKDLLAQTPEETPVVATEGTLTIEANKVEAQAQIAALKTALDGAKANNISLKEMIEALASEPETAPVAEGLVAGLEKFERGALKAYKPNTTTPLYAYAAQFARSGVMSASLPNIEVSEIKTEFGMLLSQGNNMTLYGNIHQGFDTAKYMTTKLATSEWVAMRGMFTSIVQQFTSQWTPKGKGKFTPLVIKNYRHKINVPIIPDEIFEAWILKLYDESVSPDKMPLVKYITQEFLLPIILEDIELRMIAKGEFKAAVDGEPTAAEDTMDGFETILVKALKDKGTPADKGINFLDETIDYKTCTDTEIRDFVRSFYDKVSPVYKTKDMPVFCSPEFKARYRMACANLNKNDKVFDPYFGDKDVLVALSSMYASPIIFSTPKENFIKLRGKNDVPSIINDVQKVNYEVRIFGEFWLGAGFAIGEAIFASVPASYNPKATITACYGADQDYTQWKGANPAEGL